MLRLLLLFTLTMSSFGVFAETVVPSIFSPPAIENGTDLSLYYLGAMFGNQLIAGGSDMHLMSRIFEVFNLLALSVGLIIITYTIIVGTINTAGQGKALGEKWNGVWLPIRMVIGMALLVPKAGTGYCMAQYLVIWLVIQGIGAADTVFDKVIDFFIEGGAIFASTTNASTSYMNYDTVTQTYVLEQYLLRSTACIAAHNESDAKEVYGEYKIYASDNYEHVNFGNPKSWDAGSGGQECGWVDIKKAVDTTTDPEIVDRDIAMQTYNNAFEAMAVGLANTGEFLASEEGDDHLAWNDEFSAVQSSGVTFINYLKGASSLLYDQENDDVTQDRKKLEALKEKGWILAGNYYMTLSSAANKMQGIQIVLPDNVIEDPTQDSMDKYEEAITNAKNFWDMQDDSDNPTDPLYSYTFAAWDPWEKYNAIPGYYIESTPCSLYDDSAPAPGGCYGGDDSAGPAAAVKKYGLTKSQLDDIRTGLSEKGNVPGGDYIGSAPTLSPMYYINQISSFEDDVKQDPILKAARFGKELTDAAVAIMVIFFVVYAAIAISMAVFIKCAEPTVFTAVLLGVLLTAPLIFGIAALLYAQGAMLGVFLPLIPFMIFLVGAMGWFLAVIESVVAAPLVAIGLIFPETNQEVWGRAEPAYMMILNLMLRPSLMVVGFVAAMILTWIGVELLNGAFYLFIVDAAHIENSFFGYIVITLAYISALMYIVTKAYGLINDLPNKTLMWIGDKTQGQEGAGEMLSATRGGVQQGADTARGAIGGAGAAATKTAEATAKGGIAGSGGRGTGLGA